MRSVFPPEKRAIAVLPLTNWGGLEITDLNEACVEIAVNNGETRKQAGRHKLYESAKGEPYFILHGNRYYLDEFQRV